MSLILARAARVRRLVLTDIFRASCGTCLRKVQDGKRTTQTAKGYTTVKSTPRKSPATFCMGRRRRTHSNSHSVALKRFCVFSMTCSIRSVRAVQQHSDRAASDRAIQIETRYKYQRLHRLGGPRTLHGSISAAAVGFTDRGGLPAGCGSAILRWFA